MMLALIAVFLLISNAHCFLPPLALHHHGIRCRAKTSSHRGAAISMVAVSPPKTALQTQPNEAEPRFRTVARVEKNLRLPIWPVQNGVIMTILDLIGLKSLATWLELRCGGRVCPMITSPEAQDASDPFVLLAHHNHAFYPLDPFRPISNLLIPEGFPSHPHRGFQTVTYVIEGSMIHRDNMGVKQVYNSGSVQWLNAGSGVMHEEMWNIEKKWQKNNIEIYQLWVNLPSQHKMSPAAIQLLGEGTDTPLPTVTIPETGATVVVIAGTVAGQTAPTTLQYTPMSILHVKIAPQGHFTHSAPAHHNCFAYVRRGTMTVASSSSSTSSNSSSSSSSTSNVNSSSDSSNNSDTAVVVPVHCLVYFQPDGDSVKLYNNSGSEELDFMLFEGEPMNEPRAASGSMVMNTQQELRTAYADYERGFFGMPWDHKLSDTEWLALVNKTNKQ